MPALWSIPIELDEPRMVRPRDVHGLATVWFGHDVSGAKSRGFSISLPYADRKGRWQLDVGVLDDDLSLRLLTAVEAASRRGFHLNRSPARVDAFRWTYRPVLERTWEQLWDEAIPRRRWTFEFASPAVFRAGRVSNPFPTAPAVFKGLAARWAEVAPAGGPNPPSDVSPSLAVASFYGGTAEVSLGYSVGGDGHSRGRRAKPTVGFIGSVEFEARPRTSESMCRHVDRLASLSPFSGIGGHTAFGCGVVTVR